MTSPQPRHRCVYSAHRHEMTADPTCWSYRTHQRIAADRAIFRDLGIAENYWTAISEAQIKILLLVQKEGATGLSTRTSERLNTAQHMAARSLVRLGLLEEFFGPDGPMVRRVEKS